MYVAQTISEQRQQLVKECQEKTLEYLECWNNCGPVEEPVLKLNVKILESYNLNPESSADLLDYLQKVSLVEFTKWWITNKLAKKN